MTTYLSLKENWLIDHPCLSMNIPIRWRMRMLLDKTRTISNALVEFCFWMKTDLLFAKILLILDVIWYSKILFQKLDLNYSHTDKNEEIWPLLFSHLIIYNKSNYSSSHLISSFFFKSRGYIIIKLWNMNG